MILCFKFYSSSHNCVTWNRVLRYTFFFLCPLDCRFLEGGLFHTSSPPFIESLFCARYHAKHSAAIISFNPKQYICELGVIITSIWKCEKWDTEKVSHLTKVTQPESVKLGFEPMPNWLQSLCLDFTYCLSHSLAVLNPPC